jgi:signal transduction histidine kinase
MSCILGPDVDAVLVQRTQIEQVILNLTRNAIEAMAAAAAADGGDEQRRLLISARRRGAGVQFRVADTGPGVSAELRERLFEPFVTNKPQGLGLGLSISAGIVEAHGGRLAVQRTPGGGATFLFSLPAAASSSAAPTPPAQPRRQPA